MELALFVLKWVIGPIVGVVVTLLVSDPLKDRLAPLVTQLGSKKEDGITGLWKATFYYGSPEVAHVQVIEISSLFGSFVGRIVPHRLNEGAAKLTESARPLRVRGTVKDNRFFTGVWFHPGRRSHHHGAFDLIIRQNNALLEGMWLGYSETKNVTEVGRWVWERIETIA
jgi:hypothetical protein